MEYLPVFRSGPSPDSRNEIAVAAGIGYNVLFLRHLFVGENDILLVTAHEHSVSVSGVGLSLGVRWHL